MAADEIDRDFPQQREILDGIPIPHPAVINPSAMITAPDFPVTLTVSAFVEMDMPTTMPKMIMNDLMIVNDLERNSGVTSWSSFGDDSCDLQPDPTRPTSRRS